MVVFPMIALMASYGLQKIRTIETRRFIVYSVVIFSAIVAFFAYLPFLSSMAPVNMKDAGRYLDSVNADSIEVFTVPSEKTIVNLAVSVPLLDFSTNKDIFYHHDPDYSLPFKKIEKSPLRFTWEYSNPDYYAGNPDMAVDSPVIAVISNGPMNSLPESLKERLAGYNKAAIFKTSTDRFRYSPVVSIYLR